MRKTFGVLKFFAVFCLVAMGIISCKSEPEIVTQALYTTLGQNIFSQFRFYISQDVVLTEVIPPDIKTDKDNTLVKITNFNNVINIKCSTPGRVQGYATDEKLEIAFEKLKNGTKPTISFVQKHSERNDGRYYFEYTVENWLVMDKDGRYITRRGPGIQYNDRTYLLEFKGIKEPFLLYNQDVNVKQSNKTMTGLR